MLLKTTKELQKIENHFVKCTKSVGSLYVPDLSFFVAKKSVDISGFGDKSGCDKSEDALYINRYLSKVEPLILSVAVTEITK